MGGNSKIKWTLDISISRGFYLRTKNEKKTIVSRQRKKCPGTGIRTCEQ